jgi:phage terminase large subunit
MAVDYKRLARALPDAVRFSEEILHHRLTNDEKRILRAVQQHDRVLVRSGNGLGKSWICGGNLLLWWIARYTDGICLTLAPTLTQSKAQIWVEARKTLAQSGPDAIEFSYGEINQSSIQLRPGNYAAAVAQSEREEGIRLSGYHGRLLLIVDEASSVAPNVWQQIYGLQSAGNVKVVCLFNPLVAAGPVFEASKSGQWHEIVLNCFDSSPNFAWRNECKPEGFTLKLLRSLPADLPTDHSVFECYPQWVDSISKPFFAYQVYQEFGEDSAMFQSRVLGAWPGAGDDGLINVDWVRASNQRWQDEDPQRYAAEPIVFGVDVARYGSASSVVVVRQGPRVVDIQSWRGNPTTSTAGKIILLAKKYKPQTINVDAPGVGSGVVDMLIQEGLPVREVNTGTPPIHHRDKYLNLKAEISFETREQLRQGLISLPFDAELQGQLCGIRYEVTSHGGRLKIEGKEESISRGFPSPDKADALFLAFGLDEIGPRALYEYYKSLDPSAQRPQPSNIQPPQSIKPPTAEDEQNAAMWWRDASQPPPPGYQAVRAIGGPVQLEWVGRASAPGLEWQSQRHESVELIGRQQTFAMVNDMRGAPEALKNRFPSRLDPRRLPGMPDAGEGGGSIRKLYEAAQSRYFGGKG